MCGRACPYWRNANGRYKRTRHGYARGMEPVIYVENIRRYYDTLAWIASTETMVAGDDRQPAENKIPETAFNQTR